MKKILAFFLLYSVQFVAVTPPQECFLQGNSLFYDGKFAEARACYEQIPYKNAAIWQNLGNCYYNENNMAKALVCWKRSQKTAHYQQLEQLFESEQLILQKHNCPCDGVFMRGVKKIILAAPRLLLYSFLIVMFLCFMYLFYQFVISKKENNQFISYSASCFIVLFFGIIICLLLIAAKEKFLKEKQAVLVHEKVVVRAGPEKSFHQKALLPQAYIVDVIDEHEDMYKIQTPQVLGWVAADDLEIV